jgi:hypothetical protein
VVVGLERAGRSWFHRGRAACGADRGRTYRVASSRSAATNCSVSGATTGWVLLSGTEQAKITDAFDAAVVGAVITIVRPPMRAPRATVTRSRNAGLVPGANASARTT